MYIVFKCRKCEHNLYVEETDDFAEKLGEKIAEYECPSCGEEGYENWILSHRATEFGGRSETRFEAIKAMNIDEMAEFLADNNWDCNYCSEHERLSDNPLLRGEECDMKCVEHCREWLEKSARRM